ncbi:MAG TPA: sigma-70 family RNA polymerase sigma factor [Acidimicrobiales bacterium]|nr:sigma-70 family RNA polymerase sigma factor [Acidimicrobiales bacterium]
MTEADDVELWSRIRADDADAFGLLFQRHGARIHGYVLRRTGDPQAAEDIVALVFLEAWRRRGDVDLNQPSALPWLYGVAANVLRHQHRSRRRHQAALDRLAHLPARSPALVERQAEAAADAQRVLEQVQALPRRERDVLVLSVWEGLSHAQIAVALDTTIGTVKSRLSRARARLDPDRRPSAPSEPPSPAPTAAPPAPTVLTLKES